MLGRQVSYGIGKESTAGTAVAATNWINQLSFDFNPRSEYVNNNSAHGVVERTNSATVLRQWAEGSLEAKLTTDTSGLILNGAFGSVSTAANDDASGSVYDHTFSISQDIVGQSFTLVREDELSTEAYANAHFGEWSLNMSLDDYIRFTANLMAQTGSSTTATPAYSSETEFVPKHFSVKTAATAGSLSGASNISNLETFSLTLNPNLEIDWESGNGAPAGFSSRGFDISFEMTTRYNDRTYEDAYNDGTDLAIEVSAINTDITIGTSANPGLVVTAPKMNITDWSKNEDLDSPVTQSMTGTIHYSVADAYALQAVLTNEVASY